jgi:hypothetical protein
MRAAATTSKGSPPHPGNASHGEGTDRRAHSGMHSSPRRWIQVSGCATCRKRSLTPAHAPRRATTTLGNGVGCAELEWFAGRWACLGNFLKGHSTRCLAGFLLLHFVGCRIPPPGVAIRGRGPVWAPPTCSESTSMSPPLGNVPPRSDRKHTLTPSCEMIEAVAERDITAGHAREGLIIYLQAGGQDACTICRHLHGMHLVGFSRGATPSWWAAPALPTVTPSARSRRARRPRLASVPIIAGAGCGHVPPYLPIVDGGLGHAQFTGGIGSLIQTLVS